MDISNQKDYHNHSSIANNHKQVKSDFRYSKIKTDENGILITPLALAIELTFQTQTSTLLHYHNLAKKLNKTVSQLFWEDQKQKTSPTSIVSSTKFIGGNGIGKTQIMQKEAFDWVYSNGLNPVLYNPILLKDTNGVAYPKSDKDVLIVFKSCVGLEAHEIRGLPIKDEKERLVMDDNFTPKQIDVEGEMQLLKEKYPSITYSEVAIFSSLKNFPQSILILDEINRSPELNIFNAIQNGEPVEGVQLSHVTIVLSMQNSEEDGLNHVFATDGASKTKTQIFKVYQTVVDWLDYAHKANIHPSVIAFMKLNERYWENQKDNGNEIAYPTFRGSEKLSNAIYQLEKQGTLKQRQVELLFQSFLGTHAENASLESLAAQFARFYTETHLELLSHIENTINSGYSRIQTGILNQDVHDSLVTIASRNNIYVNDYLKNDNYSFDNDNELEINGQDGDKYSQWLRIIPNYMISYLNLAFNSNGKHNILSDAMISILKKTCQEKGIQNFIKEYRLNDKDQKDLEQFIKNEDNSIFNNMTLCDIAEKLLQYDINEVKSFNTKLKEEVLQKDEITEFNKKKKHSILELTVSKTINQFLRIVNPYFTNAADFSALLTDLPDRILINEVTYGYELYKQVYGSNDAKRTIMSAMVDKMISLESKYSSYAEGEKETETAIIMRKNFSLSNGYQSIYEEIPFAQYRDKMGKQGVEVNEKIYQGYAKFAIHMNSAAYAGGDNEMALRLASIANKINGKGSKITDKLNDLFNVD